MIRPIATEVVLFLAPFLLYAAFVWATKAQMLDPQHWPLSRVLTLSIVAMVLVIGSFVYFANHSGAPIGTEYVPAHVEGGKFVPGQTGK
jgi:hypothetical protein